MYSHRNSLFYQVYVEPDYVPDTLSDCEKSAMNITGKAAAHMVFKGSLGIPKNII